MRIKLFLINIFLIILFCFKPTYSQELINPKLIGGMYYHIGYLQGLKHQSMGLGGKISYRLANNFRIGIEGYSSKEDRKLIQDQYCFEYGKYYKYVDFKNPNAKAALWILVAGEFKILETVYFRL